MGHLGSAWVSLSHPASVPVNLMGPPWHNRESSFNTRLAKGLFDVVNMMAVPGIWCPFSCHHSATVSCRLHPGPTWV